MKRVGENDVICLIAIYLYFVWIKEEDAELSMLQYGSESWRARQELTEFSRIIFLISQCSLSVSLIQLFSNQSQS